MHTRFKVWVVTARLQSLKYSKTKDTHFIAKYFKIIFDGNFNGADFDFEYHGGKWLKYDLSGFNSSHPSLGSSLDLGNPWRPLATLGDPWRHA